MIRQRKSLKQREITRKELERLMGKAAFAGQIIPQARLNSHDLAPYLRLMTITDPIHSLEVQKISKSLIFWTRVENFNGYHRCRTPPPCGPMLREEASEQ